MDPEFLSKLREAFKEEAAEQLQSISTSLIALEKSPDLSKTTIESLLRTFHSLKGSARAVNVETLEHCCQTIESLLVGYRDSGTTIPARVSSTLNDAVGSFQKAVHDMGTVPDEELEADLKSTLSALAALEPSGVIAMPEKPQATPDAGPDVNSTIAPGSRVDAGTSVRIPVDKLDEVVKLSEELVNAKLAFAQRLVECQELSSLLNQWSRRWQRLRPELENEVMRRTSLAYQKTQDYSPQTNALREFLDLHDSFVGSLMESINAIEKSVNADRRSVNTLVDTLLSRGRELTMVPFSVLKDLLKRIAWDISRQQGKRVNLKIKGGDVEIDRNILDELKDPLVHLIRNSIDHGIESPEDREALGKNPEASIEISLEPIGGGKVRISLKDDGKGIDVAAVRAAAIEKGIAGADKIEELSDQQIMQLLFRSSFSTRDAVSHISGRGLGLTIAKEISEKLNGAIELSSLKGRETVIHITVPVRRATMVGVTARVGSQNVVIPTVSMRSAVRARDQDVRMIQGRWTMSFNERLLPVVRLADILQVHSQTAIEDSTALIVGSAEQPIALLVEDVTGEQEVAVKNLPQPLTRVRSIAGATQLKNGDLAVVINMNDVLTSSILVSTLTTGEFPAAPPTPVQSKPPVKQKILVVEDSITSRVLLKNILETAGYLVSVASDGQDGWEKVKSESFDLVVTDVEMPRMNGFELTEKIRSEAALADLPVIVVTSLASLEDRRKGVEVGASAYFVKSNFEKSNLVEMVKRLI
ncbi:MAG: response regulator [Cyanobacteria bacterium HKST-UBA02]|nr:response regulator [Cyanobacteria bacterium HKST-UBA02]